MGQYFNPPRPDYYNPPIQPQNFKPSRFVITAIALGLTTTITTSLPHNYVIGQLVRLIVSEYYGSYQLNEQTGNVIAIPTATSFILDLNSIGANTFIPTPTYGPTLPQVLAIGDENSGLISSTGRSNPTTTIPGAFQNISPQPGNL